MQHLMQRCILAAFTCRYGNSVRCRRFSVTWDLYIKLILRPWLKCRHGYMCSSLTCRSCVPASSPCGSVIHDCGIDNLCLFSRPRYSHTCLTDVGDAYWTNIWIYTRNNVCVNFHHFMPHRCIRWGTAKSTINCTSSAYCRIMQHVMPNLHRPPDTTRRSCLCRVWCAGVNWTNGLNVFRLYIFCRRQSWVVGNPIHIVETDATQTRQLVLSCLTWRCELTLRSQTPKWLLIVDQTSSVCFALW